MIDTFDNGYKLREQLHQLAPSYLLMLTGFVCRYYLRKCLSLSDDDESLSRDST